MLTETYGDTDSGIEHRVRGCHAVPRPRALPAGPRARRGCEPTRVRYSHTGAAFLRAADTYLDLETSLEERSIKKNEPAMLRHRGDIVDS